uniref:Uncharacterized protein n=1 Tax=Anopheles epiroticus TaxID=199890 RepID=A0A182PKR7_9DIPT
MQSNANPSASPPIGARRVKTDLHTSEKLYVHSVGRSRSNSPMHAGFRHGVTHRKAASEPKGPVTGTSTHPATATAYLTVPHTVNAVLHSPNRQRSSSTGAPVSRSGGTGPHQRVLPPSSTTVTIERSASVRLCTSPSRAAGDHPPAGTGIANRLLSIFCQPTKCRAVSKSQLPARARLLTRRLQNNATPTNGSESPRSIDSLPRRPFSGSYKTATLSQFHNLANNNHNACTDSASTATNSAEDLTLLDKSLRNSMLQDVVYFKKQLVRMRRILQETDTLNPFENNNGQFFTAVAALATANGSIGSAATTTTTSAAATTTTAAQEQQQKQQQQQQQENILIRESSVAALALLEDQRQELADLRRQVVYLQGELTAKDRTIRQQQNLIERYEAEREKQLHSLTNGGGSSTDSGDGGPGAGDNNGDRDQSAETISTATQTERLRPVSFGGQEGLGRLQLGQVLLCDIVLAIGMLCAINLICILHLVHSRLDTTCPATGVLHPVPDRMTVGLPYDAPRSEKPAAPRNGLRTPSAVSPAHHSTGGPTTPKSKTQISSVYTQLSSVRHSYAGNGSAPATPTTQNGTGPPTALRRTSLGSSHNLSTFGLHTSPGDNRSPNKPVRTTHIGTLGSPGYQRQTANGERAAAPNGLKPPSKTIPSPSSRTTTIAQNGSVSKLNGLNGTAKRTTSSIIRPPSSFGSSNSLVAIDGLKSKSAPATPLVVPNGKLLTPAATGATGTVDGDGSHPSPNGHQRGEGDRETSESESDKDTVVNGTIGGCCSEESHIVCTSTNGSSNTVNGIVGH